MKILKKQILSVLYNHILNASQSGFQESLSINDAISSFSDNLYDRECPGAIFCYFSKAFNCVNHQLLTQKLGIYGFRGTTLSYLQSFINEGCEYVKNGNLK